MTQTTDNAHMMSAPGEMFEIETIDIRGVPTKTWKTAPPTLLAIWELAAAHGNATYLVYEDERISYADAAARVKALASGLATMFGVRQGDRVAIATRNYPEFAISFWATISLGAVVVPLNAWWTGPELTYAIGHSGAKVVIGDDERLARLEGHLNNMSPRPALVAVRTTNIPPHAVTYDEVLRAGKDREVPRPDIAPDDDATILYTSGTTGKPKGAVGTHRNSTHFVWNGVYSQTVRAFAAAAAAASSGVAPPAPPAQTATLLTFPLFHVGGLQSHLLPYTLLGGKLVLMYKWDADQAVDLILREDVNAFSGVPTTAFALLERARERGVSLPSLLGVSSGATLVPPELVRQIDTQFSRRVAPGNGYGLTETSGAMVYNAGETYVSRPDSVGLPFSPVNSVKIMTPEGVEAPTGELGEIWLKGPTVVRGYYSDPVATEASFGGGWFRTGDLGRLDSDGYLYIVDRLKDVVIRGGENVYSAEVEAVLFAHPDITDAAIVGLPHPTLGEEVAAVVRVRDGSALDAAKLTAYVKEQLAAFKVPTQWWLRTDELPRNAAGKVLKRNLRESFGKQA